MDIWIYGYMNECLTDLKRACFKLSEKYGRQGKIRGK